VARLSTSLSVAIIAAALLAPGAPASADTVTSQGPVRFEAGPDTVLELDDGRRFLDTVELRLAPDGTGVLVNELSMDAYLAGVAEMPPRWHGEALKAQAVAARTYAWRSIRRGTFESRGLGYDICGTVACQVFTGTEVVEERSFGPRWQAAVEETRDEVLLEEDGGPILARYFSSSGGRTMPNEVVFPETGAFPYLVGVEDPDDELSPLHRWEATFTREEFDDVLSRGESLAAAVPVADVERDGDVRDPQASVVVTGEDGTTVDVGAQTFREFVSRIAPERHPDRFPGPRLDGSGRLPATLPSSRFAFEVTEDEVLVTGLGWGHGVGMGQYGAHGKALRGMSYDDILAEYYNGLTPTRSEAVPDRVRVGLDVAETTSVRAEGPVRILAGGDVVAEASLGRWEIAAGEGVIALEPPAQRDAGLEVGATERVEGGLASPGHVVVETSVNKPVLLRLDVRDADGELVLRRHLGVAEEGAHMATWRLEDAEGERVDEGAYRVGLLGVDEHEAEDGAPLTVDVEPDEDRGAGSTVAGWVDGVLTSPVRLAAILLALLAVVVGARGLRRGST
jgi:SpoIID/LytB domain protein